LASNEEKERYRAVQIQQEIEAGRSTVADLPEAYGGRPTGTTRRSIRMQDEWDKQQNTELQRQAATQAMAIQQREMFIREENLQLQRDAEERLRIKEDKALEEEKMKSERENRIQRESGDILSGIRGARLPDGTVINPIRVEDENALERLENLGRLNFGMKDETAQRMWFRLYDDVLEYRQNKLTAQASDTAKEAEAKVGLAKELAAAGKSVADFTRKDGRIDFEAANAALGEAVRTGEEQKAVRSEEREEKRNINSQLSKLETDVIKIRGEVGRYQKLLEARKDSTTQRALDGALVEQGILEDEINRLDRLRGGSGGGGPQSFNTPEEAEAANLPKGTIVVIGGRRARID
jgi:hypothetical protein